MINSAKNILWQCDSTLGGNLKAGMTMEDAIKIVSKLLEAAFNGQDLSCINLSAYGITCPPEDNAGVLCLILTSVLDTQAALGVKMGQINQYISTVQQTVATISDEKVKASSASSAAKYLIDALTAAPGHINYDTATDSVKISGLTPIGSRMFINPNRLPDFDSDGYGNVGTDLEGWQIRNGKKGTDNAFGRFPLYTDDVTNSGKKGGSNTTVIVQANIASITFPITGTLSDALITPIEVEVPYGAVNKHFGVGASRDVVVPDGDIVSGYKKSKPVNLKHTHTVNLQAVLSNPQPTPVSVIPEYIKELPIEYVG